MILFPRYENTKETKCFQLYHKDKNTEDWAETSRFEEIYIVTQCVGYRMS